MKTRQNYPKLTVEKLKGLQWKMQSHLNGEGFSRMIYRNDEHGLLYGWSTNGRPKYTIQSKDIALQSDPDGKELFCDLLADDPEAELAKFVEAYNERQLSVTDEEQTT